MKKKLIVRISENLGNQLFMYANAFNIAKKLNYKLYIDHKSAYRDHDKHLNISYQLNHFNLNTEIAPEKYLALKPFSYLKSKFRKKIDVFKKRKSYIIEVRDRNKNTSFSPNYLLGTFSNILFVEGYFQSEKYFIDYKDEILKKYGLEKSVENQVNFDINTFKNTNSVSICIRQNRFTERLEKDKSNTNKIQLSKNFTKQTIEYVKLAANIIKQKINNPKFFVWSNDFNNLREYFNSDEYVFVDNNINKTITDFYSMTLCKHFIICPTTFHWWAGYLSTNKNKICIKPPDDLKFSNNKDIYPITWKGI